MVAELWNRRKHALSLFRTGHFATVQWWQEKRPPYLKSIKHITQLYLELKIIQKYKNHVRFLKSSNLNITY